MNIKQRIKPLYFALRKHFLGFLPVPSKIPEPVPGANARILVIRLDRIGDLVLSTAVFKNLKEKFPGCRITALVRAYAADVLAGNPYIDDVVVYRGFLSELSRRRNRYELVLDLLMDYNLKPALLAYLINPKFSIGFDIQSRGNLFTTPVACSDEKKHFVDFTFDILIPLGITASDADKKPEIFSDGSSPLESVKWLSENGISQTDTVVSIHPGGFYSTQHWLKNNYGALAKKLLAAYPNVKILLFGNTSERNLVYHIFSTLNESDKLRVFNVTDKKLSLCIELIRKSRLLIGNNSGLVHIAAAVGTPTVSTIGPTIPWLWRPYGSDDRNIVIRKDLKCSPCMKGSCAGLECLNLITVDEMFDAANAVLRKAHNA